MAVMTRAKERLLCRMTAAAGTTAAANIAVTGIKTTDTIWGALVFTTAASIASVADLTSECSITSDGNIQFASTNTSSNQVVLFWLQNSV
jgi:hypothetical protein